MKRKILLCFVLFLSCFLFACKNNDEHEWGKWKDCYDGITHIRHCKNDWEHSEIKEHVFDDGEILKQVSDLQNGEIKFSCIDCGYSKTTIVSPTGNHNFILNQVDETKVFRKVSSATCVYYKTCSECGAYGNDEYVFEATNLPDEYLEIEYIESTGKEQINTGYYFNMDEDSCEVDFQSTVMNQNGMIFASAQSENYFWFYHYKGTSCIDLYISNNNNQVRIADRSSMVTIDTRRHLMRYDNDHSYSLDGKVVGVDNRENLNVTDYPIYLFSWGNSYYYQGRIFACKIWSKDTLVRDFVPVQIIKTGEVGLFDLVTQMFYCIDENFVYGEKNVENTLPTGYKQIEYIESTGKQFIDTKVDMEAVWEFDIQFVLNGKRQLMGYGGSGSEYFGVQPDGTYGVLPWTTSVKAGNRDLVIFDHEGNQKHIGVNGNIVMLLGDTKTSSTFKLFALNRKMDFACCAKLYNVKTWIDGNIIRNMIPCIRDIDNKAGFYDLVSEEFFTYSEDFDFGKIKEDNDIPISYTAVEYIESDGNQYIDTGLTLNSVNESDIFEINSLMSCYNGEPGKRNFLYGFDNANYSHYAEINSQGNYGSYGAYGEDVLESNKIYNFGMKIHGGQGTEFFVDEVEVSKSTTYQSNNWGTFNLFCLNKDYMGDNIRMYECKILYNNLIVRDLVPVVRNLDGRPGLFDKITQTFYSNENKLSFKCGDVAGHDFDNGVVIKETTYYQDGDVVYTCRVCGKQIHKYEDKFAYKVTFNTDDGVETIKVFKDYNPSDFEYSNSTYTRNKNTFNYSKVDTIVIFEINLKEGYSIEQMNLSGFGVNYIILEDSRIVLSNIYKDLDIDITTKLSS